MQLALHMSFKVLFETCQTVARVSVTLLRIYNSVIHSWECPHKPNPLPTHTPLVIISNLQILMSCFTHFKITMFLTPTETVGVSLSAQTMLYLLKWPPWKFIYDRSVSFWISVQVCGIDSVHIKQTMSGRFSFFTLEWIKAFLIKGNHIIGHTGGKTRIQGSALRLPHLYDTVLDYFN